MRLQVATANVVRHPYHVRTGELIELRDMKYVFLAIDDPVAKKVIVDFLLKEQIPFIDIGMDVSLDRELYLRGQVRVTVATPAANAHVEQVISFAQGPENNIYRNIQVAGLNMLNAALAVIRSPDGSEPRVTSAAADAEPRSSRLFAMNRPGEPGAVHSAFIATKLPEHLLVNLADPSSKHL